MNQKDFIEKFHALLPKCQPEAAQPWCDFAAERVEQQQYVHFKAAESQDASVAEWLEVLYKGLHQIRETFGAELAVQVAALSLERCCLYPGEMTRAAECLQAGDSAKDILAKIASGETHYYYPVRPRHRHGRERHRTGRRCFQHRPERQLLPHIRGGIHLRRL